jgi:cyclic pyranopterin phosphate synthase
VYDRFNRELDYLRISVTDRCNLRCRYCMPEEGIKLLSHDDILTYDEITGFTKAAVEKGIKKVRLTGGEPLIRRGIVTLVSMLSAIGGIKDLSMTTNGILLGRYAEELKQAGLHRINISLDTVDPVKFEYISRNGSLKDVFNGIDGAVKAGLTPVKINCVVMESAAETDALEVADYCRKNGLEIRYIRQMDLVNGHFYVVDGGTGGDCSICNRLRLTSDGKLKPCLFNDVEFDIRKLGYGKALALAAEHKPECGTRNLTGNFYNIGG